MIELAVIEWSTRVKAEHVPSPLFSLLEAMNNWGFLPASSLLDWSKVSLVCINGSMIIPLLILVNGDHSSSVR